MTTSVLQPIHRRDVRPRALSAPLAVSLPLAAVAAAAAAVTFFVPGILRGTAVMSGSARGTALVMLVVAVPTLLAGALRGSRGSTRGLFAWLGATGYLAYNALLLLLATPFNRLFLLYEAVLGLCLATLWLLVARIDRRDLAAQLHRAPVRALAAFIGAVVVLNTAAWLRDVLPATIAGRDLTSMAGSGLTTNPLYVFDLAVWLPLAATAAVWLWRRRPAGYLAGGTFLVFWLIESIGVATDQWFGSHADPHASIATMAGSWMFAALALLGLVPVVLLLRHAGAAPRLPRRLAVVLPLIGLQLFISVMALYAGWHVMSDGWGMDPRWLDHTPFPDWRLPGLALFLLPGLGELVAAASILLRAPFARWLTLASGWGLVAWVVTQLLWMRVFHPVMHPLIAVIGLTIVALAWRLPTPPPRERGMGPDHGHRHIT